MAIWSIEAQGGTVCLKYRKDGVWQNCGSGDRAVEADLLAWVVDSAKPWDIIIDVAGARFVRAPAPWTRT